MVEKIRNEPVLATALIQALLILAVSFGLDLSDAQQAAILGLSAAVLAVVARSKVTPVGGGE
jgi:hypothetical protein